MMVLGKSKSVKPHFERPHCFGYVKTRAFALFILGMLTGHVTHTCINVLVGRVIRPECTTFTSDGAYSQTKKPRVLCYVNTYPAQYESKAIHVYNSWARKCTKTWFTSTRSHPKLPIMMLNLTQPETRMHLWVKMRKVLRTLYQQADQFDYFYKADDDTYAVVENLVDALGQTSLNVPFMTGFRWNIMCPGGYFSGGPGYVLSRDALKRIVEHAIDKHPDCPTTDEDKEDVKMCLCGRAVGVHLVDMSGETQRSLFYPYSPTHFFKTHKISEHPSRKSDPNKPYLRRSQFYLSESHISFHYMEPKWMYLMEFLVYFLEPLQPTWVNNLRDEIKVKI